MQVQTIDRAEGEELENTRNRLFVLNLREACRGDVEVVVGLFLGHHSAGILHIAQSQLQAFAHRFQVLAGGRTGLLLHRWIVGYAGLPRFSHENILSDGRQFLFSSVNRCRGVYIPEAIRAMGASRLKRKRTEDTWNNGKNRAVAPIVSAVDKRSWADERSPADKRS